VTAGILNRSKKEQYDQSQEEGPEEEAGREKESSGHDQTETASPATKPDVVRG
jgi:hypothetical protein